MNVPLTPLRFLLRARQQFAKKIAVSDGEESWTYEQYADRCFQLAQLLSSWGLRPGSRVAFLSYNTHHLLEAYYGVVLAGGIFLPLNIRLSADDFAFILNDSGAEFLFFHPDFTPAVESIRSRLKTVRTFVLLEGGEGAAWMEAESYDGLIAGQPSRLDLDLASIDEDSVAELFYTSGTTDAPKGVMLTHRNLYLHGLLAALATDGSPTDVQLHTIPLFHVNGWGTPQSLTCLGGRHIMMKKFEPEAVFQLVQKHRVTVFSLVPTMAVALLNHPRVQDYDCSSLRRIMLGGAASNARLIEQMETTFRCQCVAGYGLTETSPILTLSWLKDHLEVSEKERFEIQARTGYPIPGLELKIVDNDDRDLPWDGKSVGEIVVRGDMVMAGYWNRPEETARALRGGWFHTGDLATIDGNGYVLIVDRKKDIIVSGGENISSLEVEKALLAHPAVLECAVIPVPDSTWGEVVKALVVLKAGSRLSQDDLLAHCRQHLAGFKVPRSVEFFESLPKGGTGKILKRELREKYWAGYTTRVH